MTSFKLINIHLIVMQCVILNVNEYFTMYLGKERYIVYLAENTHYLMNSLELMWLFLIRNFHFFVMKI